jgi:hypothetical protein
MFCELFFKTINTVEVRADLQFRKEVRSLTDEERDVLLLSWTLLYARKDTDPRSYYQIAGIHGLPYTPYDEVKWKLPRSDKKDVTDEDFGGHCLHSSQLFPTWHRPYMLLIEQVWIHMLLHSMAFMPAEHCPGFCVPIFQSLLF